jgi:hypothetical protein
MLCSPDPVPSLPAVRSLLVVPSLLVVRSLPVVPSLPAVPTPWSRRAAQTTLLITLYSERGRGQAYGLSYSAMRP